MFRTLIHTFSLKFIPVRGRKLNGECIAQRMPEKLKFIPVRGRKHTEANVITIRQLLKFIPERGRKHHRIHDSQAYAEG